MGLNKLVKIISILAVIFMLSTLSSKAFSDASDIYSVFNQVIDETADNEVNAKILGLKNAKREAFYKVLKRLARQNDYGRFPTANSAAIERMIRSTSLPEEKFTTGDGRYVAKINVRFIPDAIRRFLRNSTIPYVEAQSRPLIILPVYRLSGTTLLWEDNNQWFDAWTELRLADELVPMVMPLGDITDIGTINSSQAGRGDVLKLNEISKKYGVGGTFVVTASIFTDPATNNLLVDVFGVIKGDAWDGSDFSLSFAADAGVSTDVFLKQVAVATSAEVLAIWKQRNLLDFQGGVQNLIASVPLKNLNDWVSLRDHLNGVAGIRKVTLESLNMNKAMINIEFLGKNSQLQSALAQNNLLLNFIMSDNKWVLTSK